MMNADNTKLLAEVDYAQRDGLQRVTQQLSYQADDQPVTNSLFTYDAYGSLQTIHRQLANSDALMIESFHYTFDDNGDILTSR